MMRRVAHMNIREHVATCHTAAGILAKGTAQDARLEQLEKVGLTRSRGDLIQAQDSTSRGRSIWIGIRPRTASSASSWKCESKTGFDACGGSGFQVASGNPVKPL